MNNYCIVRRLDKTCGILSSLLTSIYAICYFLDKNIIPIIDMKNIFNMNFHTNETINKINIYENYFKQINNIKLDDISYNNTSIFEYNDWFPLKKTMTETDKQKILQNGIFLDNLLNEADYYIKKNNININNTLGILLRGSDYKDLQLLKQNSIDNIILSIDNIIKNDNKIDTVFLMTESKLYLNIIKIFFNQNYKNIKLYSYQKILFDDSIPQNLMNYQRIANNSYKFKYDLNYQYIVSFLILSKLKNIAMMETSAKYLFQILYDKTIINL